MPTRTNKQRAIRAKRAIRSQDYFECDSEDANPAVIDILCDLRHFCDANKLTFADCDRIAYQHYLVELGEERKVKK